ncbi:ferric enterobactin transport system permease protein [Renibacterium salmoninarum ATCC 33209]|uniref:Ferric enterobactin transport system permease protein n=1 Tax=Renibacterium salmoninarum (strain ATCC 33209 / DSM 20767 / JCM 11484 / NBRC 15589 / NCIMB 2235) TaxID=288705 RepID=A9WMV8_RENSM|nr:iron ABC transporter permease [Renibacterium salmoninarum]ABY23419.1 ferric enterobactin transport system permease protein [Renibacterium salmoninarum ATCC 33209]
MTAAFTGRRSRGKLLGVLAVVLLLAVLASVCLGAASSSFAQAFHAIFTPTGTDMDVTIAQIRVPRTLSGIIVGACLGVAGMLVQGHSRNPIADPGLLGINQGAALAIVAVTAFAGPLGYLPQALLAFVGALIASILVFIIGSASRNGATPVTLVLAGAAVTALCAGLVSAVVLLNDQALDTLRFWQIGSLAGRYDVLGYVWPFLVVGFVLAVLNSGALNALALGEESARSLGISVLRARTVGILAITLLAGSAVTMAGPIAFAGLLVPHMARFLAGADYRWLMPTAALTGAALVLLADTAGRVIARPGELSAGVVLAVIGAPFFVVLARRRRLVKL